MLEILVRYPNWNYKGVAKTMSLRNQNSIMLVWHSEFGKFVWFLSSKILFVTSSLYWWKSNALSLNNSPSVARIRKIIPRRIFRRNTIFNRKTEIHLENDTFPHLHKTCIAIVIGSNKRKFQWNAMHSIHLILLVIQ